MVRDLGSLNGTFVNNERITESALGPGELLTVGTVTFRAVYEAEEPSGSGSGGKAKAGKSDKTVREEKTVQATKSKPAAAKPTTAKQQPKEPAEASSDSEVIEFNFEQPLMPPQADDVQVTQRIDAEKSRLPSLQPKKKTHQVPHRTTISPFFSKALTKSSRRRGHYATATARGWRPSAPAPAPRLPVA